MKNFPLVILAIALFVILSPIGLILELIFIGLKKSGQTLSNFFLRIAVSIDQMGNVVCGTLFNYTLIQSGSPHAFGHEDETISSVIGKNKKINQLSTLGRGLDWILNVLDHNHSIKNIEEDEGVKK